MWVLSFNRTSLESKQKCTLAPERLYPPFNRTSMESKPLKSAGVMALSTSFNRTSMESKLQLLCLIQTSSILLIEPVWNRNNICLTSMGKLPKLF